MAKELLAGRYDLAFTSFDNAVAYDEGQGEAALPAPAGLVALFGVDDGLLSLVAAPSIDGVRALKGRTLSVDALTIGFAFVLRDVLARHGRRQVARDRAGDEDPVARPPHPSPRPPSTAMIVPVA